MHSYIIVRGNARNLRLKSGYEEEKKSIDFQLLPPLEGIKLWIEENRSYNQF